MAKSKTAVVTSLILFMTLLSLGGSIIGALASPASPIIGMEQPLYTRFNKEAYFRGVGFTTGNYYIWMQRPDQNSTRYTGTSFQPAADGSIPSETKISINVDYPFGTYKISVSQSPSSDTSLTQCHFGLWGTDKSVYQRTESVLILGGGTWPGSSVKLIVRNPLGTFVFNSTIASSVNGTFSAKWRIPNNAVTGSDDVFIDGMGTFDDPKRDYFHKTGFTVTSAALQISVYTKPQTTSQRTETSAMDFQVKYPDASPVVTIGGEKAPVSLTNGPILVAQIFPKLTDATNGVWRASWEIPVNATLGSEYRYELNPEDFDDGFKNIGVSDKIVSDLFTVAPATLRIEIETNKTAYQVMFDSINIRSSVTYPSGAIMSNGKVTLRVTHGKLNQTIPMTYNNSTGFWHATRSLTFLELAQIGTWTLSMEANDGLGNIGATSTEVSVQPWLAVLAFACLIVGLFFFIRGLQWLRRKHWKKLSNSLKNFRFPFRKPQTEY